MPELARQKCKPYFDKARGEWLRTCGIETCNFLETCKKPIAAEEIPVNAVKKETQYEERKARKERDLRCTLCSKIIGRGTNKRKVGGVHFTYYHSGTLIRSSMLVWVEEGDKEAEAKPGEVDWSKEVLVI